MFAYQTLSLHSGWVTEGIKGNRDSLKIKVLEKMETPIASKIPTRKR